MSRCRSCPAPIMWAMHKTNGGLNPLDPEPVADGNLLVSRGPGGIHYEVLTGDELERARQAQLLLHKSHFATCPNSKAHRKEKEARTSHAR